MEELRVKKIKEGTVIDHLPPNSALIILKVLGLEKNYENIISVIMNVKSKKREIKDIIKIEGKFLEPDETGKIALIAPAATINLIKNFEVIKKSRVELPDEINALIKCANPNCITNQKEPITSSFIVERKEPVLLRCKFCERVMDKKLIEQHFLG